MKTILNIILTPFKIIWSIFDNDAHRIVSKKGLNLLQMEDKLDKQLAKETTESLTEWMESKRELSECVNCDEVKETHQICMDCVGKLIKENQENLYTEEQMVGFAEWIINQDRKLVLIYTKKSLLNEYIQSLKQK
jgi:ribosomal protein L32